MRVSRCWGTFRVATAVPVRGSSLEFAEYRKYVPGDDIRRLDWRTWGRSDRYYIKEFEADTNLRLCLIVDTSGSMAFSEEKENITRLDYARQLAGTLSYLAANQGDAVGLYSGSKGSEAIEIPAKRGPLHLGIILDQIADLKADGETQLVTALHEAAEKISQRALVVVISDLFFQPEPLKEALQHMRFRKHDVTIFHLLGRNELEFDFDRPTRFIDLEGGAPLLADPGLIARKYREAVQNYLRDINNIVTQTAIDYHRVTLDDPYDQVLARFLMGRSPKTSRTMR